MSGQPTARPWRVEEYKEHRWKITDANGSLILATIHEDKARFIVQAVNSHDELLEAAKAVEPLVRTFSHQGQHQRLVAAIARAEGHQ